jgi:hypothetical protein
MWSPCENWRAKIESKLQVHGHRASSCYSHWGGWSDWAVTWQWTYYFWLFGTILPPSLLSPYTWSMTLFFCFGRKPAIFSQKKNGWYSHMYIRWWPPNTLGNDSECFMLKWGQQGNLLALSSPCCRFSLIRNNFWVELDSCTAHVAGT